MPASTRKRKIDFKALIDHAKETETSKTWKREVLPDKYIIERLITSRK